MRVTAAPAIFDVFNARQWTPQHVASTFIPPSHFETIIKPRHSLIVGPRGSGKTTLLKMLHPGALEHWQHPSAQQFRDRINFSGVFVATDITWSSQVAALGYGRLDPVTHQLFANAAFTTQALYSLIETMHYRSAAPSQAPVAHRRVHLEAIEEERLCLTLLKSWHLSDAVPSLEGIRVALSERLLRIHELASIEGTFGQGGRLERLRQVPFLHIDFLAAAGIAVEIFNSRANEAGARWAFLFDEVELAPQWMRLKLVKLFRSVDERFLFKISLSPYSADITRELEEQEHGAGARQDFDAVKLWYVNKEQGYPFCRELLNDLLKRQQFPSSRAEELFGHSDFATDKDELKGKSAYGKDSRLAKMYRELARDDSSFASYLARRGIDPDAMDKLPKVDQAADVRKVRSIVALRLYFRGKGKALRTGNPQRRRSRKIPTVYGGATSLFAMVEGNPRWLIGIVSQLLSTDARKRAKKIGRAQQVRAVVEAANIFRAMLRTLPCDTGDEQRRGLLAVLDPVGEFFASSAIDGEFDPDPACSFTVDPSTPEPLLQAIGMALNAGAIVYAPEEGEVGVLRSVRGARFRLSYILAPHYFFPLVLGRPTSLKRILVRKSAYPIERVRDEPTLFGAKE